MGNRICDQKNREYTDAKQNNKAYECRGDIGDRSTNLTRLIGAERVSRRDFKYEGTYYVTEDGETFDKEYVETQKPQKIWTDQQREALRIIKEEKQVKYYNKTPIKVETIKQYEEYVHAVKYWQSIKKYDGKRKK